MALSLRRHQSLGLDLANRIASGIAVPNGKFVVCHVTPGGGKTLLASLMTRRLLTPAYLGARAVARSVCWVVPRVTLADQAAFSFADQASGFHAPLCVGDNKAPLLDETRVEGAMGYVTTYQSIVSAPELHAAEFRQNGPYALVLDELHHLSEVEHKTWRAAIAPLVEAAAVVIAMSGRLDRHDRERVPYVPYEERGDGLLRAVPDVSYDRRDALAERAVLPITFHFVDGWAAYRETSGPRVEHVISQAPERERRRVIKSFLEQPGYRDAVVSQCLDNWALYRATMAPDAKAIVICHSQPAAAATAEFIRARYPHVEVALATTDTPGSHRAISDFRRGVRGHVLVTVGMAYEGLDVPGVSHLACLTHFRSLPWIEQAFARATRFDPACGLPYEQQRAYLWVPDDPLMREIVLGIASDVDLGADPTIPLDTPASPPRKPSPDAPTGDGEPHQGWRSIDAGVGATTLGDDVSGPLSPAENERALKLREALKKRAPEIVFLPLRTLLAIEDVIKQGAA